MIKPQRIIKICIKLWVKNVCKRQYSQYIQVMNSNYNNRNLLIHSCVIMQQKQKQLAMICITTRQHLISWTWNGCSEEITKIFTHFYAKISSSHCVISNVNCVMTITSVILLAIEQVSKQPIFMPTTKTKSTLTIKILCGCKIAIRIQSLLFITASLLYFN